jgi:peptide-methionine (S)-S-oxide reductase
VTATKTERAILAGGCFWGMQQLIRRRPGVLSTRVGYSGGDVPNATYRNHGTHAEAIEIVFNPDETTYRDLLEFFFQIHDPTTLNRQGNDAGTQYRSAIFYHSDEQRRTAEEVIAAVTKEHLYPNPIVTELQPAAQWYEAEAYHQEYFARNPFQGYCSYVVGPKVAKFRKQFAAKLRS